MSRLTLEERILLLMLGSSEEKMISGRTLLQKTIYFLNVMLGLGIEFVPYYYGPYSRAVAGSLQALQSSGLVDEIIRHYPPFDYRGAHESRLHIYRLNEYGQAAYNDIRQKEPELAGKVEEMLEKMKGYAQSSDYKSLSISAKMYHILHEAGKAITVEEILSQASEIGWEITVNDAVEALKFLQGMDLIKTNEAG